MPKAKKKYSKKKKKNRIGKTLISFLLIAVIVLFALSVTVLFPIAKIGVKGESVYSQNQILEASGIDVGDNIFLLGSRAKQRIAKKLPYISDVKFKRYLPDGIVICVTPAVEKNCYYNGKDYFITDENNKVLRKANQPQNDLFVIKASFDNNLKISDTLTLLKEEQIDTINKIMDATNQKKLNVTSVDVTDSINIKMTVDNRFDVSLGDYVDVDGKLAHLVAMIEKIDKGETGEINLKSWSVDKPEGYFTAKNIENSKKVEQKQP